MFDKKFKIVAILGILIILGIIFGEKIVKVFSSVDDIQILPESTSLSYYKKSCEYGNSQVCNDLGDMYHHGSEITSVDHEMAVKFYFKSCELDDGKGCNNLAFMINNGRGIEKNNWKALKLYRKSCNELDTPEACYNVGAMYYRGEGTKRNYANAVYYFKKACENGIGAGCNDLGYMYEHGKYFKADTREAISYYLDACSMKEASACFNLANLHKEKGNKVNAKQFYIRACDLGNTFSCNQLESVLGKRILEIKDETALSEAINACSVSTQGGTMCYRVGLYYEKQGEDNKARAFFEKACARKQSQSCKHLGDLHR